MAESQMGGQQKKERRLALTIGDPSLGERTTVTVRAQIDVQS
jgi:hypothetical protein